MFMEHINLITTTEFANLAPEVDTSRYTDATLSGKITQASRMADDYLGYSPNAESITEELRESTIDSNGDLIIRPAKLPIISVSAITLSKGSSSGDVALTLTEGGNARYNVDFSGRYIRFPYAGISSLGVPTFMNFYELRGKQFYTKLSYRGGYEDGDLPEVIKLATVLLTREIIARAMNTAGAKKISQGGISIEYSARDGKSDLVIDAERMLRPYRRIS